MNGSIIGYLIAKKDKDGSLLYLEEDHKSFSKKLWKKTDVFLSPMAALRFIAGQVLKFSNDLSVYQLVSDKDIDHGVALWKVTDVAQTSVSYVICGIIKGNRVYYTGWIDNKISDWLVDAYKYHKLSDAVEVQKNIETETGDKDMHQGWFGATDVHIESVVEESATVDIRQDPIMTSIEQEEQ